MSDSEYASDSSYEYESDSASDSGSDDSNDTNENNNVISDDDYHTSIFSLTPYELVPKDINQYAWTVFCCKLKNYFGPICKYNIDNNQIIKFTVDNKQYTLSVPKCEKNTWYPYLAPNITYTGDKVIKLNNYVLLMHNEVLVKSNWNICTNMFLFILKSNKLLENEEEYTFNSLDTVLYEMITALNLTFSYNSDLNEKLPSFGEIKLTNAHYSTYGGRNEIYTNDKMKKLKTSFASLLELLYYHTLNSYENDIIILCCNKIINTDEISHFDLTVNEDLYTTIIKIVQQLNLNVDLEYINSKVLSLNNTAQDILASDKITFVESFQSHSFKDQKSNSALKFLKRINSEIKLMRELLSDYDIYILIAENNMQLFKVLIIPDVDTPYAYGYFEFDLFIPSDYPSKVPLMKIITTDNGRVRFGPNLYACGKICLSLLNTWGQNQWDSQNSNISQILLSIYSMIFIEHPITCEPCWYNLLSTEAGKKQSETYNKDIRKFTVDVAIKKQLQNNNTPFKDIIQKHWKCYESKALDKIKEWNLIF